jgi:hypothetical protein
MMIQNPSNKYHITIAIPSGNMVHANFAASLSNMIGFTIAALGDQFEISTNWAIGTYVHKAREQLLNDAVMVGGHYMLWLDSDHEFPMDALARLLAHDVPMVGINYSTRGVPLRYVACERINADHQEDGLGGKLCQTTEESTGLQKVEALGFGMVLMKMAIVPTLEKGVPRFFYKEHEDVRHAMGEDIWFCKLVRDAGWDIFVDADLSKECAHIGQMKYRLDHIWALKEEDYYVDYDVQQSPDSGGELAEQERSDEPDS